MKSYALFQQYVWLVNTIKKAGAITLNELNEMWVETEMSDGVALARSTFNRHRDAILDMFGIIIECDRKNCFKYYIENSEVLEENSIQNWMLSTLSVNSLLAESKVLHDRIILESIPSAGEKLHKLIEAMKGGQRVLINYSRYGDKKSFSEMKLEPYFLRLFNKRWYVIVKYPAKEAELFTLALDRITSLKLTKDKFKYDDELVSEDWYKEGYGIVWGKDYPLVKVVFRAFEREADYVRDLPLHHTQKEIETKEDYSDFELNIRITGELYTALLARGDSIKVLQPKSLVDKIKQLHYDSYKLYKK